MNLETQNLKIQETPLDKPLEFIDSNNIHTRTIDGVVKKRGGYGGHREDFSKIRSNQKRIITLSKRKKNIFKKAIELSVLCGVDIFIVVFDRDR